MGKLVERPCDYCGAAVIRYQSQMKAPRVFCNRRCRALGIHKERPAKRRLTKRPDHPIAPPGGIVAVYRLTLYDKIGPGPHPCHWCQTPVNWMPGAGPGALGALVADHLDGDDHNDSADNLVSSCQPCNATRTRRIGPDEDFVTSEKGWKTRAVRRTCATCAAEFLVAPSRMTSKKNGGTYCSRACMYGARKAD